MPVCLPGDIPAMETQGVVMPIGQLPANVYLSQNGILVNQKETPVFVPNHRLVHFDLKGAPPKIDYLQQLIPIIVQLGGTGLLIEYEDMFPYEGDLKSISATNHYTRAEVIPLFVFLNIFLQNVFICIETGSIALECSRSLQTGSDSTGTDIWAFRICPQVASVLSPERESRCAPGFVPIAERFFCINSATRRSSMSSLISTFSY